MEPFPLMSVNPLCSNNLTNSENFTKDLGAVFGGSVHRPESLNESTHYVLRSKTCQPRHLKKENVLRCPLQAPDKILWCEPVTIDGSIVRIFIERTHLAILFARHTLEIDGGDIEC